MDDITLVIPAKNEAESLPYVLDELSKYKIKKIISFIEVYLLETNIGFQKGLIGISLLFFRAKRSSKAPFC